MSLPEWSTPKMDYTPNDSLSAEAVNDIMKNTLHARNIIAPAALTEGNGANYRIYISDYDEYADFSSIAIKLHVSCLASPYISVNSMAWVLIKKNNGQSIDIDELKSNTIYQLVYNATDNFFQVLGELNVPLGESTIADLGRFDQIIGHDDDLIEMLNCDYNITAHYTKYGLLAGETDGTVIKTFTPRELTSWGNLYYRIEVWSGTILVDILDLNNNVIKTGVTSKQDLSDINIVDYPSIKVRFTFHRNIPTSTPSWLYGTFNITFNGKYDTNTEEAQNLIDNVSVTQAVNLDTMETNSDASKVKTDLITVTQAVNLDTMETNSDASKVKTDLIVVTQAVDLDNIEQRVNVSELFNGLEIDSAGRISLSGNPYSGRITLDISQTYTTVYNAVFSADVPYNSGNYFRGFIFFIQYGTSNGSQFWMQGYLDNRSKDEFSWLATNGTGAVKTGFSDSFVLATAASMAGAGLLTGNTAHKNGIAIEYDKDAGSNGQIKVGIVGTESGVTHVVNVRVRAYGVV